MSTATRLEHATEAEQPTTPGTETGTPATGVAVPGQAAPPRGEAYAVGRVDDVPFGEGRAFVAGGVHALTVDWLENGMPVDPVVISEQAYQLGMAVIAPQEVAHLPLRRPVEAE